MAMMEGRSASAGGRGCVHSSTTEGLVGGKGDGLGSRLCSGSEEVGAVGAEVVRCASRSRCFGRFGLSLVFCRKIIDIIGYQSLGCSEKYPCRGVQHLHMFTQSA